MNSLTTKLILVLTLCLLPLAAGAAPKVIVAGEDGAGVTVAPRIDLYVTAQCPYCRKAEAYLGEHGVAYVRHDVGRDKAAAKRMMQLTDDRGVPFIYASGQGLTGFSEPAYDEFLGAVLGRP